MQIRTLAAGAAALTVCAGASHAQFINSITQPLFSDNPAEVYVTNTNSGASTFLFDATNTPPATSPGFGGLAADEANRRLFGVVQNGGQTDLYSIDYDTLTPSLIGQTSLPSDTQSIAGLAYDTTRGVLYGTTIGLAGPEALFAIDTSNGAMDEVLNFNDTGSEFTFNGIDYDPLTDAIYLIDEDPTGGRGIFSVDPASPASGLTFVDALPTQFTDVDGLGAGDGRLYLLTDSAVDANAGQHGVYDIMSGQFLAGLDSPFPGYTDSVIGPINPSGAGAYAPGIPAPGAAGLAAMAGLLAGRRRRR